MADFRLLGDVAVTAGDRTLDLGPDRQRRVLAAPAVDVGRVVSVERLIEQVCHAALALHRRHRGRSGEADVLDSLGYIDHRTGHHGLAVEHYRQAIALRRSLGNTTSVADTLERLGHPQAALGQADEARATWREALDLYRQQGRHAEARRVQEELDALG